MKVLVVDDQAPARESLIRLCGRSDDLQVVGGVDTGKAAIDAAQMLNPDIMLMDVELPDMSGFELLQSLRTAAHSVGIMTARCPDHAARAFAEGALDYLVTPVAAERFDQAMARARRRILGASSGHRGFASQYTETGQMPPSPPRFLVGERQRRLYPLDPKSIDYIEADGNYVTLRARKVEYLSRDSIKHLSMQLAEVGFIRIARSLLVNAAAVSYAEVAGHGTFALTLTSGDCLHSSPAYRDSILRILPLPGLSKRYRSTSQRAGETP